MIAVSGFFDPVHVGHIQYLQIVEGLFSGKRLLVFLNSDEAAMKKKGGAFMPFEERKIILKRLFPCAEILKADDKDGTVCESIKKHKDLIDAFAKGGDRLPNNTPEVQLCYDLNIPVLFGCGKKIQSSSKLVENAKSR